MVKTCEHCSKEFKAERKERKFCSRQCNGLAQIKPKVECICLVCGKQFMKFQSDVNTYGRGRFCSFDCRGRYWSGEQHVNWNGGSTTAKDQARKRPAYNAWRKLVQERDQGKCVICNSVVRIVADHIRPRFLFPELIYEITNGRTLCRKCHDTLLTSTRKGIQDMTREDFMPGGRCYSFTLKGLEQVGVDRDPLV